MEGIYEVKMGDKPVGQVKVERLGLYYRFTCRCDLPEGDMQRLWLCRDGRDTDLGLCVPMDGHFGAEKQLPAKQCGTGTPHFYLRPRDADRKGKFIPLRPEEPFRYIHRLKGAFLARRGEQLGIVLKD